MIKLHFINVGHGDCVVVEFLDTQHTAIIDINRSAEFDEDTLQELKEAALLQVSPASRALYESGLYNSSQLLAEANIRLQPNDPITYIKNLKITKPFRFISTHPHMDHISGLSALQQEVGFSNIWAPKNTFAPSNLTESQKPDWELYKKYRDLKETKVDGVTVVRPTEGDVRDFWNVDNIRILAPNNDLISLAKSKNNPNIMSYVLLIQYGTVKIVLGGDAEEDTWKYLHENYPDELSNVTILKASHHGRDSGYYQPAVALMNPDYTIVSVGKKPDTDATNKYKQYCNNVWSTRWMGNIEFHLNSDGTGNYVTEYSS